MTVPGEFLHAGDELPLKKTTLEYLRRFPEGPPPASPSDGGALALATLVSVLLVATSIPTPRDSALLLPRLEGGRISSPHRLWPCWRDLPRGQISIPWLIRHPRALRDLGDAGTAPLMCLT